jgi:hypothetical protein
MALQSNSEEDQLVDLRKLRVMLRDPENGAMVMPFMEGVISQSNLRGVTYSATVQELMTRLLREYVQHIKYDATSSAGATRVVDRGMTTRQGAAQQNAAQQEGEGPAEPAAEERVHDPNGVSNLVGTIL